MARSLEGDRVVIFKFKSTGLAELIEEAANYIKERRAKGLSEYESEDVTYNFDKRQDIHAFVFPRKD